MLSPWLEFRSSALRAAQMMASSCKNLDLTQSWYMKATITLGHTSEPRSRWVFRLMRQCGLMLCDFGDLVCLWTRVGWDWQLKLSFQRYPTWAYARPWIWTQISFNLCFGRISFWSKEILGLLLDWRWKLVRHDALTLIDEDMLVLNSEQNKGHLSKIDVLNLLAENWSGKNVTCDAVFSLTNTVRCRYLPDH